MKELLLITKIKKLIKYLDNILNNYPRDEMEIKNIIRINSYNLLELAYTANIYLNDDRLFYQKKLLVSIKLLDFYFKYSLDKKIINYDKYKKISNHLLEITKLIYGWIKYEKNK